MPDFKKKKSMPPQTEAVAKRYDYRKESNNKYTALPKRAYTNKQLKFAQALASFASLSSFLL